MIMTATKIAIPSIQPSAIPSLMQPITKDTNAAAHNSLKISSSKQPTIWEEKGILKINLKINSKLFKEMIQSAYEFCFSV